MKAQLSISPPLREGGRQRPFARVRAIMSSSGWKRTKTRGRSKRRAMVIDSDDDLVASLEDIDESPAPRTASARKGKRVRAVGACGVFCFLALIRQNKRPREASPSTQPRRAATRRKVPSPIYQGSPDLLSQP